MSGEIEVTVTIVDNAFRGDWVSDPLALWRVCMLAHCGQKVLATPDGIARVWDCDRRNVGKIIAGMSPGFLRVSGDGWVRTVEIADHVVRSSLDEGCTPDLGCAIAYGWKMPTGPVSLWRGRGLSQTVRAQVFARDGHTCAYCGSTEGPFHIDHIHPVAAGGRDALDNLCVACAPCNISKRDKSLDDWKRGRE